MATIVLVPGAWCGGWVWQRLEPYLRAAGHEVHTPTPTGLGECAHLAGPDIDLETHIRDIVDVIEDGDLHDVVLVGWSYGGMVTTGVADRVPERLTQLIHLDAEIPVDGQCEYDLYADADAMRVSDQEAAIAAGTPGWLPIPVEGVQAHVKDEPLQAWMLAKMTPHPLASCTQPIRLQNPAAEAISRAFVFCTEDRDPDAPDPDYLTRVRADSHWRYHELVANHSAPVCLPEETARVLLELL